MAEVNAKDLTTKTAPASTDSMLLFGTSTNEGAKITVDNLANNILERLATKTFPNQVGGSSAATILAQLATLNSNIAPKQLLNNVLYSATQNSTWEYTGYSFTVTKDAFVYIYVSYNNSPPQGVALASGNGSMSSSFAQTSRNIADINSALSITTYIPSGRTFYLWVKGSASSNSHGITAFIIGDPSATVTRPT